MSTRRYKSLLLVSLSLIFLIFGFSSCTVLDTSTTAKSYALIIGINDYANLDSSQDLTYCVNDARGIYQTLINNGWDESNITLLVDESGTLNATKANILNTLSLIIDKATAEDFILVYYSGHGTYVPDNNNDEVDGYDECIIPVDFDPNNISSVILDDELGNIFSSSKTQKGVFIFDSCYSGGLINKNINSNTLKSRALYIKGLNGTGSSNDLDIYSIPVLTASSQNQYSWESPALQHGVFTYFIIRGIEDREADFNDDGYITVREIFKYAEINTKSYVSQLGYSQDPEIQEPQFFTDILITH